MRLIRASFFSAVILAMAPAGAVFGEPLPETATTWECPQANGDSVYTNKERAGCHAMALKPLSVVPDLEHMPTAPRTMTTSTSHYQGPALQDRASGMGGHSVPDWARDWYASNTGSGSVQAEVCTLYLEWMHLVQKTRGGFFFGSDPSYGGDITGRTQRGPSHSFYDNARYIALSRLFGTGFVPIGCF